ncbi:unnamed protein product [Symbiodinium natans]|uniref:SAM domain-containing protein n=1 Tax=Symbiodinium natans TaxID=878477 RepID=A0A812LM09_9DINO|nr:unnamed protein product [Symbiodinium natans]
MMSKGTWSCMPPCSMRTDWSDSNRQEPKLSEADVQGPSTSAYELLSELAPRWSAGPEAAGHLDAEAIETALDVAKLDKEDLRELGLTMAERSRVLQWSASLSSLPQTCQVPAVPAPPPVLDRHTSDLPLTLYNLDRSVKKSYSEFSPSPIARSIDTQKSPWVEIEACMLDDLHPQKAFSERSHNTSGC